jgi:Fe-S oxidoreductase
MQLYYSRYPRPIKDHLVANIETLLPLMAKAPKLVNAVTQPSWAQGLTAKLVGYTDTPALSVPTLAASLAGDHALKFDLTWLQALSAQERENYVLIVQDPFTSFYEAPLVHDLIQLARQLGKVPMLVPFKPNGKAQHVKGFLRRFGATAQNTAAFLNQLAALNIPLVGVDPALVLCYRDEYCEALGKKRGDFNVQLSHEWLMSVVPALPPADTIDAGTWYLFGHCTEKTQLPHVEQQWAQLFAHFGAELKPVSVGCCGMAGTYGHEADKRETSQAIYDLSWSGKLAELPAETGYSCRSQVKRFSEQQLRHPLQVLLRLACTRSDRVHTEHVK